MKKILIMFAVLVFAPLTAFAAAANNGTAGSPLELTGLTVSVSPGVFAYYTDGGNANPQWYLIATVHQGGTKYFATAQNSTSIFKMDADSPNTLGELTSLSFPTEAQAASEDYWSKSSSWER